jgi:hypothetical protein
MRHPIPSHGENHLQFLMTELGSQNVEKRSLTKRWAYLQLDAQLNAIKLRLVSYHILPLF